VTCYQFVCVHNLWSCLKLNGPMGDVRTASFIPDA